MSLYIGNLPSRIRREELERVFQRFGQCDVRIKDGYGFVVYGFAPQAEKAMKMLQGRKICGQQLTISWSNKQPRPFQRNARGARSYEPRGRLFGSRDIPSSYRDLLPQIKQPDGENAGFHSDNPVVEDESHGFREDLPRNGDEVMPESADNGRWGERADLSIDGGVHDDTMFDRYEPYHGHDTKDKDESRLEKNSNSSARGSSQDHITGERADVADVNFGNHSKFQRGCFNCGALDHKIRDCPKKHTSRGIFKRFDRQADGVNYRTRDGDDIERFRSKVRGNIQSIWGNRASNNARELHMENKDRNFPETTTSQGNGDRAKRRKSESNKTLERSRGRKSRKSTSTSSISRSASKSLSLSSSSSSKPRCSKPLNPNTGSGSSSLISLSVSLDRPASSPNLESNAEKADADSGNASLPASKSDVDKPSPMSIPLEEMCGALKHYGLELSEMEIEKKTSVQSFFGSARLWPWESVFYRRAKKGPISVENYARRVAQNKEYGIVDKFIRSSSGWEERSTETP